MKVRKQHQPKISYYTAKYVGTPVKARNQKIAYIIDSVAKIFDGDVNKAKLWVTTPNPMFGDISPLDLVRAGKFEIVQKYVSLSMEI